MYIFILLLLEYVYYYFIINFIIFYFIINIIINIFFEAHNKFCQKIDYNILFFYKELFNFYNIMRKFMV